MVNINFIRPCLMLVLLVCGVSSLFAQSKSLDNGGSIVVNFERNHPNMSTVEHSLNAILGVPGTFSFQKEKQRTDGSGMTHTTYSQYYAGIKVEHGTVLVHSKNEMVISINGKIMTIPGQQLSTTPMIQPADATNIARKELHIVIPIADYRPELVIYPISDGGELVYKIRVDGLSDRSALVMYHVYVSAISGKVINKVTLIAHQDVQASANTYYSGVRSITTDSFSGGYRLRDNARRIETYNVKGMPFNQQSAPAFANPNDVVNATTTWSPQLYLMSTTLTKASDSIRYAGLFDASQFNPFGPPQTGWLIHNRVDKLVPPSSYQNVKDEIIMPNINLMSPNPPPPVKLPITQDLGIVIDAPQYTGAFSRDSALIALDFSNFSISATTLSSDTNMIRYNMDDLTPGVHPWTNSSGDEGNYKVSLMSDPAVDVHWGMGQTYDFYNSVFNYYSYDNDSTSVIRNYYDGVLQASGTQNNAAALPAPYHAMVYGTGDGVSFNPLVTLDVEGHEFTHLVTVSNANLNYQGESGALNESFSDMMGTAIVSFSKGPAAVTWHVGDGVTINIPYMRSLSDPKAPATFSDTSLAKPQPDTYLGQYWADTGSGSQDNGGVHINSGVGNKWFYLLAHGGSGTNDNQDNYNITAIGMDKAQRIAFSTFTDYLIATSNYHDAYTGSLLATAALYGQSSTEYATVRDAWKAVGIPKGTSPNGMNYIATAEKGLALYPNPSDGRVHVTSSLAGIVEAEVFSIIGAKMLSVRINPGLNDLDMTSWSKGVYFLQYTSGNRHYTEKIVLSK